MHQCDISSTKDMCQCNILVLRKTCVSVILVLQKTCVSVILVLQKTCVSVILVLQSFTDLIKHGSYYSLIFRFVLISILAANHIFLLSIYVWNL
jgi:hypothetical protein